MVSIWNLGFCPTSGLGIYCTNNMLLLVFFIHPSLVSQNVVLLSPANWKACSRTWSSPRTSWFISSRQVLFFQVKHLFLKYPTLNYVKWLCKVCKYLHKLGKILILKNYTLNVSRIQIT